MNNAIVTVVHPQSLRWFPEFITGLREQTETNFHCIVVLDSVDLTDELETLLRQSLQSYEVLHSQRGPLLNRFVGLKASEVFGAERVACIDSDDIPGPTWVEVMMNTLDDCELAFCDLIPVDQDSAILGSAHFQHRYKSNTSIDVEVLNRGNLTGFGNTAFRTSLLPHQPGIPTNLRAPDWAFFRRLLSDTPKFNYAPTHIYYRQYGENMAGLPGCRERGLLLSHLQTKLEHLSQFPSLDAGDQTDPKLYHATIERLGDEKFCAEYWERTKVHQLQDGLMWWEDIQVYKDML